ncbi:MAG: hypothetical protein JXA03_15570 [Bacteroidales bacterium]|nr:hypothetical protein [Bacteroidales bacterium]
MALVIMAAVANSIMDTLKFRFTGSFFDRPAWMRFCGPMSWKNKWKPGTTDKERFPGSSTLLVWTTDLWHLAQMAMKTAFILAIILYSPLVSWWADFIIYSIVFSLTFELFFSKVWKKK